MSTGTPGTNDLRRRHPDVWRATTTPRRLTVPPLTYLAVDGRGDPNSAPEYTAAVGTLYPVAYGLRAMVKADGVEPWTVMPLEGLWWADDLSVFTAGRSREEWRWTLLLAQPPVVDTAMVEQAVAAAVARGRAPAADRLELRTIDEGDAVQVLHVGPYREEGPTIARLHEWAAGQGLALRGHHHEVYLGDPRRTAPERLPTILRQPVTPAGP